MYFVIKYNWSDKLTDKHTVGFFDSLLKAKRFVLSSLRYDRKRNTVAIIYAEEGPAPSNWTHPEEVYAWSDTYDIYVPVDDDDVRRKVTLIY